MKKILIMLLVIMSTNVLAEWTKIGGNPEIGLTSYVDFQSMRKNGNEVKMWLLYDFNFKQTIAIDKRYLSVASRNEYDCSKETTRILDGYWYSGNMKNGEVVYFLSNIKSEPSAIIPATLDESFFKLACGQR